MAATYTRDIKWDKTSIKCMHEACNEKRLIKCSRLINMIETLSNYFSCRWATQDNLNLSFTRLWNGVRASGSVMLFQCAMSTSTSLPRVIWLECLAPPRSWRGLLMFFRLRTKVSWHVWMHYRTDTKHIRTDRQHSGGFCAIVYDACPQPQTNWNLLLGINVNL